MKKYIFAIPVLMAVAIVPILSRGHMLFTSSELHPFSKNWTSEFDLFTWYKAQAIMLCGLLSFLSVTYFLIRRKLFNIYLTVFLPTISYAVLIVASSLSSKYPFTSWFGIPESNQGAFTLLSYLALMIAAFLFFREEKPSRLLLAASLFSVFIVSIVGILQIAVPDFTHNVPLFYKLLVGNNIGLDITVGSRPLSSTMANSNHLGMFAAISLPLTLVYVFTSHGIAKKFGVFAVLSSLFLLIGSESRASWLAALLSITIFFFAYKPKFLTTKRVYYILASVVILIGLIFPSVIFNKLISIASETGDLFSRNFTSSTKFQHLSVQNGEATIIAGNTGLRIKGDGSQLHFQNLAGRALKFQIDPDRITILEPEYSDFKIIPKREHLPVYFQVSVERSVVNLISTQKGLKAWEWGVAFDTMTPKRIHWPVPNNLFSGRSYLWSITLPLLKETLWIGKGPATFINYFPQKDLFGKATAGWTPDVTIDRPHNTFMQIIHATGLISFICFLYLLFSFLEPATKILFQRNTVWDHRKLCLLGSFSSTIAYIFNASFNDSAVSFAPLFWISFGMGLGLVHELCGATEKERSPAPLSSLTPIQL